MTFEQILVFHTVVQTGSFKAAAAELHKTQPAISFAIKKLEEEMSYSLFDRSAYRPVLTEHGKIFLEKSLKVLSGMGELNGLTKSFQNQEEPEINISIDGISPLPKLLKVFKSFSDRYQNTKLNLSFDILSEAESKVLTREAEIGVTHFLAHQEVLESIPITQVKMIPVISRELFQEKKIKHQSELLLIDQIVVGEKKKNTDVTFGLLEAGKRWRLSDPNFKRDIILAGLGWGHLPEHTIEREIQEGRLMILDFEDIHPRVLEVNLIRLKRVSLGKIARNLWDELSSLHE